MSDSFQWEETTLWERNDRQMLKMAFSCKNYILTIIWFVINVLRKVAMKSVKMKPKISLMARGIGVSVYKPLVVIHEIWKKLRHFYKYYFCYFSIETYFLRASTLCDLIFFRQWELNPSTLFQEETRTRAITLKHKKKCKVKFFKPLGSISTRIKRKWIYESILTFSHHSLFKTSGQPRARWEKDQRTVNAQSHLGRAEPYRVAQPSVLCTRDQELWGFTVWWSLSEMSPSHCISRYQDLTDLRKDLQM